ncbi:hypothetical protein GH714_002733 [Hevea brasiliensis]|uniref:Uncharacterized protein n=1 Tax=Hevea brasiliensis TaxID=3981 RepID=A0A6A6KX28_HEVBR|nr:hypothetical protein GH714_002733 [Hevea brasiliensis]
MTRQVPRVGNYDARQSQKLKIPNNLSGSPFDWMIQKETKTNRAILFAGPCGHSTTPRCRTVISLKRYLQIYRWVFPKDSTDPDGIPKKHENETVAPGLDCKYESVTMSRQFEYELKRMLQQELRRLQENASFQKLSGPCQTKFKSELHEDFKTNFQNIFSEAFQEASALIKSTESAEVKLAHESPEGETTSQGFQNDNLSSSS